MAIMLVCRILLLLLVFFIIINKKPREEIKPKAEEGMTKEKTEEVVLETPEKKEMKKEPKKEPEIVEGDDKALRNMMKDWLNESDD